MINQLERWIAPLKRRVYLMVGKAVITAINDAGKIQTLKISLMSDENTGETERIQEAGFTSAPIAGCEAVAVCVGGNRDNMIIIATDSSGSRPTGLAAGEVCLYNIKKPENKILIKDGEIKIFSKKVTIESGDLKVNGKIEATGAISGSEVSLAGVGTKLSTHVHPTAAGVPTSPPTPGT